MSTQLRCINTQHTGISLFGNFAGFRENSVDADAVSVVGRCSKLMLGVCTRTYPGYHHWLSALDSAETWFAVIFTCSQVRNFKRI